MLSVFAHTPQAVIPAKAGIQLSMSGREAQSWTPAFAGVTADSFDLEFGV
jgi:hypothetical protein